MGKVKLTGFRELDEALSQLPKATGKNVLRRVAKGALEPMAEAASAAAPVGPTGRLGFSIAVSEKRTRRAKTSSTRRTGAGFRSDPKSSVEVFMGPGGGVGVLPYAAFVEFGTIDTAANPYMRPAWDRGAEPALDYIKDNLGQEIERAAKRYAKKIAKGA